MEFCFAKRCEGEVRKTKREKRKKKKEEKEEKITRETKRERRKKIGIATLTNTFAPLLLAKAYLLQLRVFNAHQTYV
jgi:hypothetical protein